MNQDDQHTQSLLLERNDSLNQSPGTTMPNNSSVSQTQQKKIFGKTPDDLKLLTGMIIHCSDFTGAAKEF